MKKLPLPTGAEAGFVLDSRMGRGPHHRSRAGPRQLAGQSEDDGVAAVSDHTAGLINSGSGAVNERVSTAAGTPLG